MLSNQEHTSSTGLLCEWIGCDQLRRQKWSLVNHIQEKHCNENALKLAAINRQRGIMTASNFNQNNNNNTNLLNLAKDAALLALQRNQKKNMEEFVVLFFV